MSTDIARILIDKDADINARDKSGNTPLSSSACAGYYEITELLSDKSADVNISRIQDYLLEYQNFSSINP